MWMSDRVVKQAAAHDLALEVTHSEAVGSQIGRKKGKSSGVAGARVGAQ